MALRWLGENNKDTKISMRSSSWGLKASVGVITPPNQVLCGLVSSDNLLHRS